jgi:phosphoglycolate phosphatase
MAKYDAVFFDLDGTLIETAYELADAVNDTLEYFSLEKVEEERCKKWIGHGTKHLLLQAIAFSKNIDIKDVEKKVKFKEVYKYFRSKYFRRIGTRSWLFSDVLNVLKSLKENGIKVVVITNKEETFTKKLLQEHNLFPLLDLVIAGDTLSVKKPDPKTIFNSMEAVKLKDLYRNTCIIPIRNSPTFYICILSCLYICIRISYKQNPIQIF